MVTQSHFKIFRSFAKELIRLPAKSDLIWYIAEEVVSQLGFEDCVIYEYDPARNILVQVAAHGDKQAPDHKIVSPITIPYGQGITGYVAKSRKSEIVNDTTSDERYIADLRHMQSEITVPIIDENRLFGVIDCESSEKGFFNAEHLEFLETVASMLASRLSQWEALEALKQSKRVLAVNEATYRSFFQLSEDPMMLLNKDGFLLCNAAAANVFQYASPEEMQVLHPADVSPEIQPCGTPSAQKAAQMMQAAFDTGYHRFEWMHQKKSGEKFPVEVTLSAVPFMGQPALYAVCRDITEAKKNERATALALEEARAANMAKSRFLANMSHELRTPLNAILGFSDVMRDNVLQQDISPQYMSYAENIYASGAFLLDLIRDILDLSAIDACERRLDRENVETDWIIAEVLSVMTILAEQKDITIETDTANAPSRVWCDKRAIIQIIVNLLSNAVKFSDPGTRVFLKIEQRDDRTVLSVTDRGRGIARDKIGDVVKRFERGHVDPQISQEGIGLGLAIVDSLVKLHDGTMEIDSETGKGTRITISLPGSAA
ncbi:ATP-binding protein [Emcibacter nanhaiensis]|uniref:histidine kinase n=1 Tax=Emcibacter nanhaiensis TaxID=1505037 RepID=A0A501PFN7_9PROT|nr:ATP-binding protein [Emcibacter nanhaiensis]TPD58958.1 GAF domain-containing protein [Emcibacter nanhaiensis]